MKKIFKVLGYIIAVLLIILVIAFAYYYVIKSNPVNEAEAKMGDSADTITINGFEFRDLNKNGELDIYEDHREPVDKRVEDLLNQMTVEEKAGMFFHNFIVPGDDAEIASALNPMNILPVQVGLYEKHMNHFNLFELDNLNLTAKWLNKVQKLAERTRLGIPVTISTDPRHTTMREGAVIGEFMEGFSHWCEPIGFAAIGDSAFTHTFGEIAAQEYRAIGIHTALHPMADLATDPRWGRISGTFGEDAQLSAKLTQAYVLGFQGDSISNKSVSCMTKHFPGGGPQKDGEDPHFQYGKDQVYPGNNLDYHLIPFRAAIEVNTSQMMPYYGIPRGLNFEEVAFGFNKGVITDLLKDSLGYEGIVCTDWQLITKIEFFGRTFVEARDYGVEELTTHEKVKKALEAGVDQFGGEHVPELLVTLVNDGRISEERLDRSVRKLLKLKFQLGLFENPYVDLEKVDEICGKPKFKEKGYASQLKSQVLLTNKQNGDKKILPLSNDTRIYIENLDKEVASEYGQVVQNIDDADVIIMDLSIPYEPREGFLEYLFKQGRLHFTEEELSPIIEKIKQKPTVVTMYMERPAVIPEIVEHAHAVVATFGASDKAIFDVLYGKYNPTGKLPFQMPSTPASVKAQKEDVPFDLEDPLFDYGHGLSY